MASHPQKFDSVLLFGAPGSGKGTVGKSLASAGGHLHLSSGDVLRGLDSESELGKTFHEYMKKGLLFSDEEMMLVFDHHMKRLISLGKYYPDQQFLLLDGIPRTAHQVELMRERVKVRAVIVLDVADREVLIQRLMGRSRKEGRADDADGEVLRTRMKVYDEQTAQVLQGYPEEIIHRFRADQRPLETLRDILDELAPLLSEKFRL